MSFNDQFERTVNIEISEADFDVLFRHMSKAANQLRGAAKRTQTGYGTARSYNKRMDLLDEADKIDNVLSKIANELN